MPETQQRRSAFERHPVVTIGLIWFVLLFAFLGIAEIALRELTGLGRPALFYKDPSFGYRLKPNQETTRFGGAHFKINNLGLRADSDWDSNVDDKILFLGDSVTYGGNHISNDELFSSVAVQRLDNLQSGNVGMPEWGVENVYGLVVETEFLPASIYVTTFIEDDFYRGLTSPENRPWIPYEYPPSALHELAEFLWAKWFANPRNFATRRQQEDPATRINRAARKLKAMDEFLKSEGFRHIIFISPTQSQVVEETEKSAEIAAALENNEVEATYILDKVTTLGVPKTERSKWFQDTVHLTPEGHRVWGDVIYKELRDVFGPP